MVSGLSSHTQKFSEWSHLCGAGCDNKETRCTTASVEDTFDIQQVSNGVHGCVQVGRIDLMFIDIGMKINGAHYRGASDSKLPPAMLEICAQFFVSQQGNAPDHHARETIHLFKRQIPVFISPDLWPPKSTDLNPLHHYKIWGQMQQQIYQVHECVDKLKQRLIDVWNGSEAERHR